MVCFGLKNELVLFVVSCNCLFVFSWGLLEMLMRFILMVIWWGVLSILE